jgi:hypothetical protein
MKNATYRIFGIVLLSVVLLAPGNVSASQQNKKNQTEVTHPKPSAEVPHFNEIIPLSSKLSGQLAKL